MLEIAIVLFLVLSIVDIIVIAAYLKKKHKLDEVDLDNQEKLNQQKKALEEVEQKLASCKQQNSALDTEISNKLIQANAIQERYDTLTTNLAQIQDTYDVLVKQAEQNYEAELEELIKKKLMKRIL